jgi:hypothetical protein
MNPPLEPQPRQRRDSVRHQARLDWETHSTLEARGDSAVRHAVGITHTQGWTIDPTIPDRPHLVHMLVAPELLQHVQAAAGAYGASVAAWLRQAMRQVSLEDFPPRWRAEETAIRSHESSYFHRKFGLGLDEMTSRKLEALTQTFNRSAAEIIRQLMAQARPEDFPRSWHVSVGEPRQENDA